MKFSNIFSALLFFTIPVSEKLMASQTQGAACPMVSELHIKLPDRFMPSDDGQNPSINAITCGDEPNTLQIQASTSYIENADSMSGAIERAHNFSITLKPISSSFNLPIKTTLKSLYNPKNYQDAKSTPFPKVVVENGLTYVRGRSSEGHPDRVDFYLKPDKKGNTDMAIYCYLSDGVQDARNCMMGYADEDLSLDVVVKISESEVRDYKNIKQSVSEIIDSIIEKDQTRTKNVNLRMTQAPEAIGA
jgi:hypothetical protein